MKRAFTLLEAVLYLALFAMIFLSIIRFSLAIAEGNAVAEQRSLVNRSAIFVSNHLNAQFKRSQSVDEPGSIFFANNGKLRLVQVSSTVEYNILDNRMNFDNGSNNYLVAPGVIVNQFLLDKVTDAAGRLQGVKITLSLYHEKNPNRTDQTYTSFFTLN